MVMSEDTVNIFVYGSLRDPLILKSVCGLGFSLKPSKVSKKVLFGELALLPNYRRVSPDNVYYYAIHDRSARIEGIVLYDMPSDVLAEIDKYEGKFYDREPVEVHTGNGIAEAVAYLVSHKSMRKYFGDRFHVNLIHELWLRKRIEKFFKDHTRPGEDSHDADTERRARRELLGTTERDLVISHLGREAMSDFFLEHELDRPNPCVGHLFEDPEAKPYLKNYFALIVKQVILNQFEQKIQDRFRYDLERLVSSSRYFTRTISLLISLRMLNSTSKSVDMVLKRCFESMPCDGSFDLIDYVKYAVSAADSMFDSRVVWSEIARVRANRQPGLMPLGAELELSNLGFKTIYQGCDVKDEHFDGFRYFDDFLLDTLTWKLGGYIDDHGKDSKFTGNRGFLELAPGRLNVLGEVSKPATNDPWVLNQLIHEIAVFYPVKSHSLHLTLQMRKNQISSQRPLRLSMVKCLLALGGGMETQHTGTLWVSRMGHDEIRQDRYGEELIFARRNKRRPNLAGENMADKSAFKVTSFTQQYKFIRLDPRANYEPLIMALKGLQISYNPDEYLTAVQLSSNRKLQNDYEELKRWASNPTEISRASRSRFLDLVQQGLLNEGHRRPAHQLHYIDWVVGAIDVQLRLFNKQIQKQTEG